LQTIIVNNYSQSEGTVAQVLGDMVLFTYGDYGLGLGQQLQYNMNI